MKQLYMALLAAAPFACEVSAQSGTFDPTYGNGGITVLQPGTLHDVAYDVVVLGDNTSLICGVAQVNGRNSIFIAHLLNDGSLDLSWGTNSGYTFFSIGEEAYGYAMGLDSQGRIYVTGIAYPTFAQAVVPVVRVDGSGQPDSNWGPGGVLLFAPSDSEAEARDLAVKSGDRIVLAGSSVGADFDRDGFFLQLLDDGTPDPNFGSGGFVFGDNPDNDQFNCMAVMADEGVVGAGSADVSFVTKTWLYKVDAAGSPENAFGSVGAVLPDLSANTHAAWGIAPEGTQVFVTGYVSTANGTDAYIIAVKSDGLLNPAFSGDGMLTLDLGELDYGYDIALHTNSDLVICGTSGQGGFAGPRDFLVARYTASGDPVMSFGTNGSTTTSIQQDFDDANALAIDLDGKILLAGFTSGFSTLADNDVAVCRYDVDWTLGAANARTMEIAAYPNPVSADVISITHDAGMSAHMLLRDAAGRLVRDYGTVPSGCNRLSVAGLPTGQYVLELRAAQHLAQQVVVIAH